MANTLSIFVYEKYPELKYKYRNRDFGAEGIYVDTVGKIKLRRVDKAPDGQK